MSSITREQAERLLYPPETGLFLVRESTNYPGDYTLCVSCDGKVDVVAEKGNWLSLSVPIDHRSLKLITV
uniref:SH2 domain-containing protein n=1 Tax=Seriola lalandi dorsalis TaxID=1841481 RepID=A0A3B4WRL4_SERLL